VVFAGRLQTSLVRPCEDVLAMTLLHYESQLKKPGAFAGDIDRPAVPAEERKLAETLIETATAKDFDLGRYKDEYAGKLAKLVEGKTKHKKRSRARAGEEPAVINLMDALRESPHRAQKGGRGKGSRKAPSSRSQQPAGASRKRKPG
jgi:non-homologous end joining protein Ku